jgi:hypothetical protein
MGLPFSSGHILGLRCFPGTSLGTPYKSVWHRDPQGNWIFYQNAVAERSCPRYFGKALLKAVEVYEIKIEWTGPADLLVSAEGTVRLEWSISLTSTVSTRIMNVLAGIIPAPLWQNSRFLYLMGKAASSMLGAGKLGLSGKVPNGQEFIANPKYIWFVRDSKAILNGNDLGPVGKLTSQAKLGDFWIPQKGIVAIGDSMFEPLDGRAGQLDHLPPV